jgi:AAA domain-containing protein
VRAAAQAHPSLFVRHEGLLVDEVQRVPDLFLAIKHEVDVDTRPGRFLLTGSARLLGLQEIPDMLPGRPETIELSPLSQGEIDGLPDGFVEAVFRHGTDIRVPFVLGELTRQVALTGQPVRLYHYRDRTSTRSMLSLNQRRVKSSRAR